nr:cation:proton antiporter [Dankookia rubra]
MPSLDRPPSRRNPRPGARLHRRSRGPGASALLSHHRLRHRRPRGRPARPEPAAHQRRHSFLGELGIVLLMFIVGLEFSLPRLIAARGLVLGMGSLQVGVTATLAASLAWFGSTEWLGAIVLGGAVAMSYTALTLRQLAARGELGSRHGRLALGVLLFQDLATLPFLVLVGAAPREGGGVEPPDAEVRATVALGVFLAVALLARRALAWLIEWVARRHSAELCSATGC